MSEERERKKHGVGYWCCLAIMALVLVPVVYVASIGPAHWLVVTLGNPSLGWNVIDVVYAPIRLDEEEVSVRSMIMASYVNWWVDHAIP